MSAQLNYITSGKMEIFLEGITIGKHFKDPQQNVKHFGTQVSKIELESADQGNFTEWGSIELIDVTPYTGLITVSIDCDKWFFFGSAQFQLIVNGQIILSDNFQSGVRGPLGNPKKVKRYAIGNF